MNSHYNEHFLHQVQLNPVYDDEAIPHILRGGKICPPKNTYHLSAKVLKIFPLKLFVNDVIIIQFLLRLVTEIAEIRTLTRCLYFKNK